MAVWVQHTARWNREKVVVAMHTSTLTSRSRHSAPIAWTLALLSVAVAPISAEAVCTCLNNATVHDLDAGTGGDDGQFADQVVVNAPAGQTWRVTAQSGAYDAFDVPPVGTRSALVPIATDGSVVLTPTGGGTQYVLDFVFVEGAAWDITVSNGMGTTLAVGNNCFYPDPTFAPPIANSYPASAPPVTLGAVAVSGPALASATFTIDSTTATQLVPADLAPRPVVHVAELTAVGTDAAPYKACTQGARKRFSIVVPHGVPLADGRWGAALLVALLALGMRAVRRA